MEETYFGVDVVQGTDLARKMGRDPRQIRGVLLSAVRRSGEAVYARAAENLSGRVLNVRTGTLRRRLLVRVDEEALQARVGSNVKYARIHEFGGVTRPHEIRPVRGLALRFATPGFVGPLRTLKSGKLARRQTAGAVTFAQVVHHPGSRIPARPWLRPALRDSRPDIQRIFEQELRGLLTGRGA